MRLIPTGGDSRIALSLAVVLSFSLSIAAPEAAAKKKSKPLEAYSGHTINVNTAPTGTAARTGRGPGGPGGARGPGAGAGGQTFSEAGSTFVTLEIHRWTTDEERQKYASILAEKGSEAMVDAMRDDKESVGWVRLPGTVAYDLKYARAFEGEQGRQIVVATDRPVSMGEAMHSSRSLDYGVTIVAFTMPPSGEKGEGTIVVGAELALEDNNLILESASMNPIQFNKIKRTK